MVVTIFGGDLRTGLIRVRNIAATNGSCAVTLGGAGTIGAGVRLPQADPFTGIVLPLPALLVPGKSFLAWEEDGVILNAGPIWSDDYSFDTKKLQMNAAGLRSYWDYRFVIPALDDGDPDDLPSGKDTVISGVSLRTIAKRLVQQAQSWTAGSVPVVFEDDFPGDALRTYKGHELHVVNEKLKQLSEVQNGPDIMFNPRYTDDARTHIEWLMETGDPQIKQAGAPHKWDASGLPNPSIKGAGITRDATGLTTDNYQTGSTPEDTPEDPDPYPLLAKSYDSYLTDPARMYPRLESSVDRSSVINRPVLQSGADEATMVGRMVTQTWKFQAKKDVTPKITDYRVGHFGKITTKDDPFVGSGDQAVRIMEISTTLENAFATLTCAPSREAI